MMSILGGVNALKLKRFSSFQRLSFVFIRASSSSSSGAAEIQQCDGKIHFMVDYLINSLGFSREEAISVSTKVGHFKSAKKPDSVINFFKQNGFDKIQISRIVSSFPKSLSSNVQKTLEPKIKFLQGLGLHGSDLVKFISGNQAFFWGGLDTHMIPTINYLKELLGSQGDVVKVLRKCNWLLVCDQRLRLSVLFLKECQFSNDFIRKFIILKPRCFLQNPGRLKEVVRRADVELGICRESPMFIYGLRIAASNSQATLEMKFGVFRIFGWTDSDIITLTRKLPNIFSLSEAKIRDRLKFFTQELGFSPLYLAHHPAFLSYSLQNRVLPRYEVLKFLKEKKLLRKEVSLYTVVALTEAKFLDFFLLPYKDEVPDLYQSYVKQNGHMT